MALTAYCFLTVAMKSKSIYRAVFILVLSVINPVEIYVAQIKQDWIGGWANK